MEAALTTALTSIQGTILGALAAAAPVGITVMGTFLAWRYGVKFFKSLSK